MVYKLEVCGAGKQIAECWRFTCDWLNHQTDLINLILLYATKTGKFGPQHHAGHVYVIFEIRTHQLCSEFKHTNMHIYISYILENQAKLHLNSCLDVRVLEGSRISRLLE